MHYLTDFADQAVLLPVALLVAVCLALVGWRQGAIAWLIGVGGTLLLMFSLKVGFIACGSDNFVRTPSGHTAAAAVVLGGLMAVIAGKRQWTLPVALGAAVVIGFSRLALHTHLPLEILIGAAAGTGGALLIAALAGPRPEFRRSWIAILLLAAILLLHGLRLPAEAQIRGIAYRMAMILPVCRMPPPVAAGTAALTLPERPAAHG